MAETQKSDFPGWLKRGALAALGTGMLVYALSGDFAFGRKENIVTYHNIPPQYKHIERRVESLENREADDWGLLEYSMAGTTGLALLGLGYVGYQLRKLRPENKMLNLSGARVANRISLPDRTLEGAIIVPERSS